MMDPIRLFNLIIVVAGMVMSAMGIIQVFMGRNIETGTRRFFAGLFIVLELYLGCILIRSLTASFTGPGWVALSLSMLSGQAVLSSVLAILSTCFLLYQSKETSWYRNNYFRVAFAVWVIYIVLQVYNLSSGILFYMDDKNNNHRGPLFFVQMIPIVFIMVLNLYVMWKKKRVLTQDQKTAFIIYAVMPMIAMVVQSIFRGLHLIAISTVVSALFMLIYIFKDQSERYYREEAENSRLKMNIMLAQIQPHFLYNTLTTIRHICAEDPALAQTAIDQLSGFLRHNMDSLTTDIPIAFEKELEHTRNYLALQELRFGEDLVVEYDLQYTDFRLPTLTLQPLVENAVTYGIRRKEEGCGVIKISTSKTGEVIEVIVEDDGPGFAAETLSGTEDGQHIGIRNVRERIENMLGGELIIETKAGTGTRAVIRLKESR